MLKLHKPTNRAASTSLHFRFSHFQALQVPKGWDRLFVSLISVETGKSIAKLGKALVKNGTCQWTETLSESFHLSTDECLLKILVSSGSTRSNILGETTINVAHYAGSRLSAAVSQPLKKCSHGTILQLKIQRLTPRSKHGDEESRRSKSHEKDENVDRLDLDSISYNSNDSSSITNTPKEDLASPPLKTKEESSESASGVFCSFHSDNSCVKNAITSKEDDSPASEEAVNSRVQLREEMKPMMSSRNLLEAAEDTIEELRVEAKMWERNARKLMVDLDVSRNDFSNLSKKHAEMGLELSAAYAEQDWLKREVDKLKLMMDEVVRDDPIIIQSESLVKIGKVLENEIKYQQDLNDDLGQQLKRSQESNVELLSVLQELEETIQQQRVEIRKLEDSVAKSSEEKQQLEVELRGKSDELESERKSNRENLSQLENDSKYKMFIKEEEIANLEETLSGYVKDEHFKRSEGHTHEDLIREIELLREKVDDLEKDCTELTDENLELLFKLKNSNKTDIIRKCSSFDSMTSDNPTVCPSDESVVSDSKFHNSYMDPEEVKKNAGFESCEHFAEILKQMEVAFNLMVKPWHVKSSDHGSPAANKTNAAATKMSAEDILILLQELNKLLELRINESIEIHRNHEIEIKDRNDAMIDARRKIEEGILKVQEHEESKVKSEEKYAHLVKEYDLMEADLLSKEQEKGLLLQRQVELETIASEIRQEKSHLEQALEVAVRENKESSECMENLQDDIQKLKVESEDLLQQWLRSKEECELLKEENQTLKESKQLESVNSELKRENHEQHEKCSALVDQLNESKKSLSDCTRKVELLEEHLISVVEEFEMRENNLRSDLDSLMKENSLQKEKLAQAEAELRVEELSDQIAASKQSHERLKGEHERILKQLEMCKKSEEKLKTDLNDVELKHTISNYEREQLTKETSILKIQLQNIQEEMLVLKSELKGCRADKGKVEITLHSVSGDYEELKAENISLSEKISALESVMHEFEECKRNKLYLEEKIQQMDKDLAAKEIIWIQNGDLKNEITELKRVNMQFQQKMYSLEEERDGWLKKAQALEENLKLMERENIHNESNMTQRQFLETEVDEEPDAGSKNRFLHPSSSSSSRAKKSSSSVDSVVTRERYERTKSSLETELIDLRERYLEMSLKYAEVEAQREDLVMKLRASRGGKRWFL